MFDAGKSANGQMKKTRDLAARKSTSNSATSKLNIGQILLAAKIISAEQLHHALNLATDSKQRVGRLLIGLGYIKETELDNALLAQSLIADGSLTQKIAVMAVKLAFESKIQFNDALAELDLLDPLARDDEGWSALLVPGGVMSAKAYDDAIDKSAEAGLHIGQYLLLTHAITTVMLDACLVLAAMLRDGSLTTDEAITVLKRAQTSRVPIDVALKQCGKSLQQKQGPDSPRLGELLTKSTIMSERETMTSVEGALSSGKMLGEEIIDQGLLPAETIDNAMTTQNLIAKGVISKDQGISLLKMSATDHRGFAELAKSSGMFEQTETETRALKLCRDAGLVRNDRAESSEHLQVLLDLNQAKFLLASNQLNKKSFDAAQTLVGILDAKQISDEQAIEALKHCEQNGCDISVSLAAQGLSTSIERVKKNDGTNLSDQIGEPIKEWMSFRGFQMLLWQIPLIVILGYAVHYFLKLDLVLASVGTLVCVALLLMKEGLAWQSHGEGQIAAKAQHVVTAQETKTRLMRKKSAD
jgi:hypothetical protein